MTVARNAFLRQWSVLLAAAMLAVCCWTVIRILKPKLALSCGDPAESLQTIATHSTQPDKVHPSGVPLPSSARSPVRLNERIPSTEQVQGLRLRVSDANGVPILGADIMALEGLLTFVPNDFAALPSDRAKPIASSGADGIVELPALWKGRKVAIFGPAKTPKLVMLKSEKDDVIDITLYTAKGGSLQIEDDNGAPVPGARLLIEARAWGWALPGAAGGYFDYGATDLNGCLRLPHLHGRSVRAVISAESFVLQPLLLGNEASKDDIHVHLTRTCVADGRISDPGLNGSVLPELFILAEPDDANYGIPFAEPVMPTGSFSFTTLGENQAWWLTPCRRTDGRLQRAGETVPVVPPFNGLIVQLEGGFNLRVRALDPSGSPVAPTVLASLYPRDVLADPDMPCGSVHPNGAWTWTSLHASIEGGVDLRSLWVTAEGYLPFETGRYHLHSASFVDLGDVVLQPGKAWTIRVLSSVDGTPISGAMTTLIPNQAGQSVEPRGLWIQSQATDERGEARLLALERGGGVLNVRKKDWLPEKLLVLSGENRDTFEVRLQMPARIQIACTTLDGLPASNAPLAWRSSADPAHWETIFTGNDGSATIEVPPGNLDLRSAPGALRASLGNSELRLEVPVPAPAADALFIEGLVAGEFREVALELPVFSALGIRLRIADFPAEGYHVLAMPGQGIDAGDSNVSAMLDVPRAMTDDRGECVLQNVPAGVITFAITDSSYERIWYIPGAVTDGLMRDLYLDLPTRSLVVEVRDETGSPLAEVPVCVSVVSPSKIRLPRFQDRTPSGRMMVFGLTGRAQAGLVLRTNAHGRALFADVPTGQILDVACAEPGSFRTLSPIRLDAEARRGMVELRMGSGASLEVQLNPVDRTRALDSEVRLRTEDGHRSMSRHVNAAGLVRFDALPPGKWRITVTPSGEAVDVILKPGECRREAIQVP